MWKTREIDNTLSNQSPKQPYIMKECFSDTKIHIFHFLKQMCLNLVNMHEAWHSFTARNLTHSKSDRKYPKMISDFHGCEIQACI